MFHRLIPDRCRLFVHREPNWAFWPDTAALPNRVCPFCFGAFCGGLQQLGPWPGHGRVGGGPLGLDEPAPEGLRGLVGHRLVVR